MALYRITLYNPQGTNSLQIDDWQSIEAALVVNSIGSVVLYLSPRYPLDLFRRDCRLWIERQARPGAQWKLLGERFWLVRRKGLKLADNGQYTLRIVAYDPNYILDAPIVAYAAGSTQADKTDNADDMMKAIIRENLGSLATDTARNLSAYISVAADVGTAPSIDKAFAWQNVLKVLQDIAKASTQEGTYLAFDLVATNPNSLQFRTYTTQRGADRRWPSTGRAAVVLGPDNLSSVEYEFDATNERTVGYAGGAGEEEDRLIETASDATRLLQSPFARREIFRDVRNIDDPADLEDEAKAAVRGGIPVETYTAAYVESSKLLGVHFDFGDYVTINFAGTNIDCRIDALKIKVDNGDEKVDIVFRSDASDT